jgi:hypothetical protein
VPAPGTPNVIVAVFRSFAFAESTNPNVDTLIANTGKRAVRVAIACNDALFVLILLFMIFSSRVHGESRVSFKPETGEVISADAYCDPVPECLGRFGCTAIFVGTDIKPTSQDFSIRTLTYMPSDLRAVRPWNAGFQRAIVVTFRRRLVSLTS